MIYIKESNVIAPYRNERVSVGVRLRGGTERRNPKMNSTSTSSFEQGAKKITFQLEVWSKTEDVVQTLLQVRTVWKRRSDKGRVLTACMRLFIYLF